MPPKMSGSFPEKLHHMLENPAFANMIAWLPHGRAFRILDQKDLEDKVLKLYFKTCRYTSFARQINGWGFKRIVRGVDCNAYYHEFFVRGKPELCKQMKRFNPKHSAPREALTFASSVVPNFHAAGSHMQAPPGQGWQQDGANGGILNQVTQPCSHGQRNALSCPYCIPSDQIAAILAQLSPAPPLVSPQPQTAPQDQTLLQLLSTKQGKGAASVNPPIAFETASLLQHRQALPPPQQSPVSFMNMTAAQEIPSGIFNSQAQSSRPITLQDLLNRNQSLQLTQNVEQSPMILQNDRNGFSGQKKSSESESHVGFQNVVSELLQALIGSRHPAYPPGQGNIDSLLNVLQQATSSPTSIPLSQIQQLLAGKNQLPSTVAGRPSQNPNDLHPQEHGGRDQPVSTILQLLNMTQTLSSQPANVPSGLGVGPQVFQQAISDRSSTARPSYPILSSTGQSTSSHEDINTQSVVAIPLTQAHGQSTMSHAGSNDSAQSVATILVAFNRGSTNDKTD